ncbi:MAG: hypothetical protein PHG44_01780 [Lentisphaeria bacterium]|nr:hypothetical protein [Lentisphaeria bacterium]MDY0176396.1 hypothetical protein [Lentisphaeria bacterium]NLZ60923.1 hypothetical protein [Lentisphaerota bacterium]
MLYPSCQSKKRLRSLLGICAAFFVLCALALYFARAETHYGGFQLSLPEPPFLGQPGLLSYELQSWRKPEPSQLRLHSPSQNLDFSAAKLQLRGIGTRGFKWRIQLQFWAVKFADLQPLSADYANKQRQVFTETFTIMPRPGLRPPGIPTYSGTEQPSAWTWLLFWLCLALAALDLLLRFLSQHGSHQAKALRSLRAQKSYSAASAKVLWRIWQANAAPCWQSQALGRQIRQLRFAQVKNPELLHQLCRQQLQAQLKLLP